MSTFESTETYGGARTLRRAGAAAVEGGVRLPPTEPVLAERAARGLGWFSVALGTAELVVPRAVARIIGIHRPDRSPAVLRGMGARELAAGLGILLRPWPRWWMWARVAGDALDLGLLGWVLREGDDRARTGAAIGAVAGVTAMDILVARQLGVEGNRHAVQGALESITVNRPVEEVYAFWRNFENFPRFMAHLDDVRTIGERRSRWSAKGPAGITVQWEAELVEDRPNELVSWRSLEGADVENEGTVRFVPAPGGRGTEIHVKLRYDTPAGRVGTWVAKLFGREPSQQVAGDLRRLKQVMETGEVVHSDASIHRGPHAARPSETRGELS